MQEVFTKVLWKAESLKPCFTGSSHYGKLFLRGNFEMKLPMRCKVFKLMQLTKSLDKSWHIQVNFIRYKKKSRLF